MQNVNDRLIQLAERAVDADVSQEVLNVRRAGQLVLSIGQHQWAKDDRDGDHRQLQPVDAALVIIVVLKLCHLIASAVQNGLNDDGSRIDSAS